MKNKLRVYGTFAIIFFSFAKIICPPITPIAMFGRFRNYQECRSKYEQYLKSANKQALTLSDDLIDILAQARGAAIEEARKNPTSYHDHSCLDQLRELIDQALIPINHTDALALASYAQALAQVDLSAVDLSIREPSIKNCDMCRIKAHRYYSYLVEYVQDADTFLSEGDLYEFKKCISQALLFASYGVAGFISLYSFGINEKN